MRKVALVIASLVVSISLVAQESLYIHKSDHVTLGAPIEEITSVYFSHDGTLVYFQIGDTLAQYQVSEIDSLTFGDDAGTVKVVYNGDYAMVCNPLAFQGVTASVEGADVTISTVTEDLKISYYLSGDASDGSFKLYSTYKCELVLDGVNLTNPDGPAVNIQTKKKCTVTLNTGTTNSLTDGVTYATSTEDQKSTLFSEGQLDFEGTGSLTVTSLSAHAICSDDYIKIDGGTITVAAAKKDGIHANDHVGITGGALTLNSEGDGINCEGEYILISGGNLTINSTGNVVLEASGSGFDPAYSRGIRCDSTIIVNGGTIAVNCTGKAGKGISAGTDITINNGNLNISVTGNGSTYRNSSNVTDSYNATCITSDGNLSILGGTVIASASGTGGKGITVNGTLTVDDLGITPTVNIVTSGTKFIVSGSGENANYNEPKAIKADGAVTINKGSVTISSNDDGIKSETSITVNNGNVSITKSYEAFEAPFITINNGSVSLIASNDGFNATKGNGGEADDGSCLYLNGGTNMVSVTNGDGLDSNGSIVMTGGTYIIHGPERDPEVGMDVNGTCTVSGGLLVVSGTNSNMLEGPNASSQQYSVIAKTTTRLTSTTLFHIQDASGNDILTFQPERNYYSVILSAPGLSNGSTYSIYTGGSSSGTKTNGLYSGGTYSGGTLKRSFTISGKVTNVTF